MLAIDIDGCLNYIKEDIYRIGRDFFKSCGVSYHSKGYYLNEIWCGAPEDAYAHFWEEYGHEIYTNPPRSDAIKVIKYFKRNQISACYITSRDVKKVFSGIGFTKLTEDWLLRYGIDLPIYYCPKKELLAQELCVTCIIEDNPESIKKLQKVTRVLIFDHPYNDKIAGEHVKNWEEIVVALR